MNVSGTGGVYGDVGEYGGSVGNVDFYAPGDSRTPKILGIGSRGRISYMRRLNTSKRSKKGRKKIKSFYDYYNS